MGSVKLVVGEKYDSEECDKCKSRNQKVVNATPSDPFDGTSCIDLKCVDCGNESYHWTEGHVIIENSI